MPDLPASPRPPLRLPPRALTNAVLAAFTLRWLNLERFPLWLDEGYTWSWATQPTWGETALAEANHPPVWWLVTRAWAGLFGTSEESLRAPAALAGVAVVLLAWRLAQRLLDPAHAPRRGGFARAPDAGTGRAAALWVAGAVATSAYLIEFSQEARMYALLTAEALGLALLYLRWLDRGTRGALLGYAALAVLAVHTHYFALWPLLALGVHALLLAWRTRAHPDPAQRVPAGPFVLANLGAGLLCVPWLLHVLTHFERLHLGPTPALGGVLNWIAYRMGAGDGLALGSAAGQAAYAVWGLLLVAGTVELARRPGARGLAAAALGVPLLGLAALSVAWPFLHERYVVFLAPWAWLVAAAGAALARGWRRPLLLTLLGLLSVLGAAAYHLPEVRLEATGAGPRLDDEPTPAGVSVSRDDPGWFLHRGSPPGKEAWREVAAFVGRHAGPGSLVVLYPGHGGSDLARVWDYYAARLPGGAPDRLRLATVNSDPRALLRAHGDDLMQRPRVFLIVSHVDEAEVRRVYGVLFKALGVAWNRAGAQGYDAVPPIPFTLRWPVHVAVLSRR